MAQRLKKPARYEDLLALPENMVGEILDGELIASPRPASLHARATSRALMDLGSFDGQRGGGDKPGGWHILVEPELHLGGDVIVPDIACWRRERMPVVPDVAAFELAPDWVCETLSPSTARIDRGRKLRIYAREGVTNIWLLDRRERLIEVFRLVSGTYSVLAVHEIGPDTRARLEPFDALELDVARWFSDS
jgi:Uma2 family endonuclease